MYLEYVLYGNQFYPMAIDPYVTPDLERTPDQGLAVARSESPGSGVSAAAGAAS